MRTPTFTPQRHRIARLRLAGYSHADIAEELGITYRTVAFHFNEHINRILNVRKTSQFAISYIRYCEEHQITLSNLPATLNHRKSRT